MDSNEKREPPYFARCSIGSGKWFWVAAKSLNDWCERQFIASGVAASAVEAEAAARASIAKALGDVVPQQFVAYWAKEVYHREIVKRRASKAASSSDDAAGVEYVYTDWTSDYDGRTGSSTHRIVKKTAKRVYVEYRDNSWTEDGQTYSDVQTIVLDREELETKGWARSRRWRLSWFYTTPYEARHKAYGRGCLNFLGVKIEATRDAVNAAYRKLAKVRHPNHGGNAEEFKELQHAYEDALKIVKC
jgi:hypothetical protein